MAASHSGRPPGDPSVQEITWSNSDEQEASKVVSEMQVGRGASVRFLTLAEQYGGMMWQTSQSTSSAVDHTRTEKRKLQEDGFHIYERKSFIEQAMIACHYANATLTSHAETSADAWYVLVEVADGTNRRIATLKRLKKVNVKSDGTVTMNPQVTGHFVLQHMYDLYHELMTTVAATERVTLPPFDDWLQIDIIKQYVDCIRKVSDISGDKKTDPAFVAWRSWFIRQNRLHERERKNALEEAKRKGEPVPEYLATGEIKGEPEALQAKFLPFAVHLAKWKFIPPFLQLLPHAVYRGTIQTNDPDSFPFVWTQGSEYADMHHSFAQKLFLEYYSKMDHVIETYARNTKAKIDRERVERKIEEKKEALTTIAASALRQVDEAVANQAHREAFEEKQANKKKKRELSDSKRGGGRSSSSNEDEEGDLSTGMEGLSLGEGRKKPKKAAVVAVEEEKKKKPTKSTLPVRKHTDSRLISNTREFFTGVALFNSQIDSSAGNPATLDGLPLTIPARLNGLNAFIKPDVIRFNNDAHEDTWVFDWSRNFVVQPYDNQPDGYYVTTINKLYTGQRIVAYSALVSDDNGFINIPYATGYDLIRSGYKRWSHSSNIAPYRSIGGKGLFLAEKIRVVDNPSISNCEYELMKQASGDLVCPVIRVTYDIRPGEELLLYDPWIRNANGTESSPRYEQTVFNLYAPGPFHGVEQHDVGWWRSRGPKGVTIETAQSLLGPLFSTPISLLSRALTPELKEQVNEIQSREHQFIGNGGHLFASKSRYEVELMCMYHNDIAAQEYRADELVIESKDGETAEDKEARISQASMERDRKHGIVYDNEGRPYPKFIVSKRYDESKIDNTYPSLEPYWAVTRSDDVITDHLYNLWYISYINKTGYLSPQYQVDKDGKIARAIQKMNKKIQERVENGGEDYQADDYKLDTDDILNSVDPLDRYPEEWYPQLRNGSFLQFLQNPAVQAYKYCLENMADDSEYYKPQTGGSRPIMVFPGNRETDATAGAEHALNQWLDWIRFQVLVVGDSLEPSVGEMEHRIMVGRLAVWGLIPPGICTYWDTNSRPSSRPSNADRKLRYIPDREAIEFNGLLIGDSEDMHHVHLAPGVVVPHYDTDNTADGAELWIKAVNHRVDYKYKNVIDWRSELLHNRESYDAVNVHKYVPWVVNTHKPAFVGETERIWYYGQIDQYILTLGNAELFEEEAKGTEEKEDKKTYTPGQVIDLTEAQAEVDIVVPLIVSAVTSQDRAESKDEKKHGGFIANAARDSDDDDNNEENELPVHEVEDENDDINKDQLNAYHKEIGALSFNLLLGGVNMHLDSLGQEQYLNFRDEDDKKKKTRQNEKGTQTHRERSTKLIRGMDQYFKITPCIGITKEPLTRASYHNERQIIGYGTSGAQKLYVLLQHLALKHATEAKTYTFQRKRINRVYVEYFDVFGEEVTSIENQNSIIEFIAECIKLGIMDAQTEFICLREEVSGLLDTTAGLALEEYLPNTTVVSDDASAGSIILHRLAYALSQFNEEGKVADEADPPSFLVSHQNVRRKENPIYTKYADEFITSIEYRFCISRFNIKQDSWKKYHTRYKLSPDTAKLLVDELLCNGSSSKKDTLNQIRYTPEHRHYVDLIHQCSSSFNADTERNYLDETAGDVLPLPNIGVIGNESMFDPSLEEEETKGALAGTEAKEGEEEEPKKKKKKDKKKKKKKKKKQQQEELQQQSVSDVQQERPAASAEEINPPIPISNFIIEYVPYADDTPEEKELKKFVPGKEGNKRIKRKIIDHNIRRGKPSTTSTAPPVAVEGEEKKELASAATDVDLKIPESGWLTGALLPAYLEVRETKTRGLGLFAKRDIPKKTMFEYKGVYLSMREAKELEKKDRQPGNARYGYLRYLTLAGQGQMDAHPRFGWYWSRFVNEPPEDEVSNVMVLERKRPIFVFVRDVKAGEEILWLKRNEVRMIDPVRPQLGTYEVGEEPDRPQWFLKMSKSKKPIAIPVSTPEEVKASLEQEDAKTLTDRAQLDPDWWMHPEQYYRDNIIWLSEDEKNDDEATETEDDDDQKEEATTVIEISDDDDDDDTETNTDKRRRIKGKASATSSWVKNPDCVIM